MITDKSFRSFARVGDENLKHAPLAEKIIGAFRVNHCEPVAEVLS
jgi:hypothetical protein